MTQLDGPRQDPAAGGKADSLVIFLHGVGADGHDLIGLAPMLSQALPNTAFVSPHGVEPYDMAPFGYQWFSLRDRGLEAMSKGAARACGFLDAFIDAELERLGLTDDRLAVLGFSQGTMMALYCMPRRPRPCAAVVGMSGALLDQDGLMEESISKPPMLLIHGAQDDIVPVTALNHAKDGLRRAGFEVETEIRRHLNHGIDQDGIASATAFLKRHLYPNDA